MRGEGDSCDLKASFDPASPKAKVELVKDLVSFANAGGGQIKFGYTETDAPGVPRSLMRELDGAKLTDLVGKYVAPGCVHISHAVEELYSDDRVGIIITVAPYGKYPLVFNREGDYHGGTAPVFRKGDIYTRHGAKSERANYQDIVWFIDRAVESSRGELMRRIDQLARLPEGYRIKFVPPTGAELDEPNNLLATVAARRSQDRAVMLSGRDLLWCWKNREQLELTDSNIDLLVRRALLEVGSLVVADADLNRLIEGLRTSRYAHFNEAVRDWPGRNECVDRAVTRVRATKWEGELLTGLDNETLVALSDDLTAALLEDGKSTKLSRALSDIGRTLFLRAVGRIPQPEE